MNNIEIKKVEDHGSKGSHKVVLEMLKGLPFNDHSLSEKPFVFYGNNERYHFGTGTHKTVILHRIERIFDISIHEEFHEPFE
jgi:hypothetical protein